MQEIAILAGTRRVDDVGPKGGARRRFQVWIERRDWRNYAPDGRHCSMHYGEIFSRQWEAAQAAIFAAEQCRAAEAVFRAFR